MKRKVIEWLVLTAWVSLIVMIIITVVAIFTSERRTIKVKDKQFVNLVDPHYYMPRTGERRLYLGKQRALLCDEDTVYDVDIVKYNHTAIGDSATVIVYKIFK